MPDRKRMFDLPCCVVAAPLAAGPGLLIAVAIRVFNGAPVLHRGPRMGRDGRPFDMLKFRTMTVSTGGPRVTASDDPRVTRLGRWLRRTKLDEIPQLINVLRGEMSVVGPRPEDPRFVARFPDEYAEVLVVRPGITGPAAVQFRYEEILLQGEADPEEYYATVVLPAKLALDLQYVGNHDLRKDLAILLATLRAVLRRTSGATPARR